MAETIIEKQQHKEIIELIKTNTLQEIGDRYGVSRERIRQILYANRITRQKRKFVYHCQTPDCPAIITLSVKRNPEYVYCIGCRAYEHYHQKNPRAKYFKRKFISQQICKRVGCNRISRCNNLCNSHSVTQWRIDNPEKYRLQTQRRLDYLRNYGVCRYWYNRANRLLLISLLGI